MSDPRWIRESGEKRYYGSPTRDAEYVERAQRYPGDGAEASSRPNSQYIPRYAPEIGGRRGSDAANLSRRAEQSRDRSGGQSRSQPIPISRESRGYHPSEGSNRPREGTAYLNDSNYGSPSYSRIIPQDPLADGMNNLRLNEQQYVVSTTPARTVQWGTPSIQPQLSTLNPVSSPGPSTSYPPRTGTTSGPQATTQTSRLIKGTPGEKETLDPSYIVRNRDWERFFRTGRVFSTLWTDSFSDSTNPQPQNDSENNQFMSSVSYVRFNQKVHSKIRRFVVVRLVDMCCTCLPVTTYDGRGYRKKGINLDDHGLIHSSDKQPGSINGITKRPLKVRLSKGADKLINPSYINYGRVYTVQANVKVKDVGELDLESQKLLRRYYNQTQIFIEDDDEGGAGPAPTSQAKAVEFSGMGGGVMASMAYQVSSYYPAASMIATTAYHPPGGYGLPSGYNQSTTSWSNTGTFGSAQRPHNTNGPGYSLQPPVTQYQAGNSNVTYSASPLYSMYTPAPSNLYPSNTYSASSSVPASHYTNVASSSRQDQSYEEEPIRLPTAEEVQQTRRSSHRDSVSKHGGGRERDYDDSESKSGRRRRRH